MRDAEEPPEWIQGTFNATKCAAYLRGIGAEIDDAAVQSWLDAEKVHRWLLGEKRIVRRFCSQTCRLGHTWESVYLNRGGKAAKAANTASATCPECGEGWCFQCAVWGEARDGSVTDFRPLSERWRPLPGQSP